MSLLRMDFEPNCFYSWCLKLFSILHDKNMVTGTCWFFKKKIKLSDGHHGAILNVFFVFCLLKVSYPRLPALGRTITHFKIDHPLISPSFS